MSKLSLYYIVKNEEARLAESLEKVIGLADEIVVVDSGSTDKTVDIAESFGAKVIFNEWKGFAAQKAYAASLCRHDWVLDLDADEILSDELITNIRQTLESPDLEEYAGFKMRWVYVPPFPEHPMKHAPHQHVLRFYNRKRAVIDSTPHSNNDRPQVASGRIGSLNGDVYHKALLSLTQIEAKYVALSTDQANDYVQRGRRISSLRLIAEFPVKFMKYYFLYGNFRNGWYGYSMAVIAAYRNFMRFAKAREGQLLAKVNDEKDR